MGRSSAFGADSSQAIMVEQAAKDRFEGPLLAAPRRPARYFKWITHLIHATSLLLSNPKERLG